MGYRAPRTYTLGGDMKTAMNPVDATAYAIGGVSTSIGSANEFRWIRISKSGIVRTVGVTIVSATAIGTNEDWTLSLNDGTTTTTIATLGAATTTRTWLNGSMNFPVVAGGYLTILMTTPTWVTNPEGCTALYSIIIEYE